MFNRYNLNDNNNAFIASFENVDDALNALKEQRSGSIDKLNTVTKVDVIASVDYDDFFGDVSRLKAAWNRIDLEGAENNGSGRKLFCLQCVSTEAIAEMLDANGDWGDLDDYIDELGDRAGVDRSDYENDDWFDDSGYFTEIQKNLGINIGY